MNRDLRKIINHYGLQDQLNNFQNEVFKLNKAIIKKTNEGLFEGICYNLQAGLSEILSDIFKQEYKDLRYEEIKVSLANVLLIVKQFQLYYNISTNEIKSIMKNKISEQIYLIDKES